MFDDKKLWKERASGRVKDLGRYLRYIFNGHLVVVLLFLIGTASFYYQQWIENLPAGFPVEIVIAVVIGFLLTYSPVYNFLLEADQIFILPLEDKLKGYFLRSGIASLVFQGYLLLMVLAVLMPMYAHISINGFRSFFPFFVILLVLKAWNLAASWRIDYFVQSAVHRWDMIVRYFINATFTFLLFKQASLYMLLVIAVVCALYYRTFYVQTKNMGLKWDRLINQEEKRMASFYRLANMFTDVPKLRDTVKRRKWLDLFLNRMAFSQKNTYLYLFSRAFLRSSDYLGLFLRLTIIGALAIYFISFGMGQILLGILFLYLTGFQLLPLWNHHQNKLWVDLYPVEKRFKTAAFSSLLMTILTIQSVVYTLLILVKGEVLNSVLNILAGLVFTYMFVHIYAKKRLNA
ncbi:ABC transporter permease [Neobacillus sp. MER 74]|uniref:ABC transporter permease n=1 Tax=Neobacillus sp. MER 74 TaxID=2939566 RepID=UPI0020409166|nr:ABC transporter permease [Neobacillus sp. MER 74]MCM3114359.1 ABC transporter permease [Neobacillus sp. MER 74]